MQSTNFNIEPFIASDKIQHFNTTTILIDEIHYHLATSNYLKSSAFNTTLWSVCRNYILGRIVCNFQSTFLFCYPQPECNRYLHLKWKYECVFKYFCAITDSGRVRRDFSIWFFEHDLSSDQKSASEKPIWPWSVKPLISSSLCILVSPQQVLGIFLDLQCPESHYQYSLPLPFDRSRAVANPHHSDSSLFGCIHRDWNSCRDRDGGPHDTRLCECNATLNRLVLHCILCLWKEIF